MAPRLLTRREPRVRELVTELLDEVKDGFDAVVLAKSLTARAVSELIGLPKNDWPQLKEWTQAIHAQLPFPLPEIPEFGAFMGSCSSRCAPRNGRPRSPATRSNYGEQVVLHLQSANWDEQEWGADAEEFDLERPMAGDHLAFGKGIHACLGAPMARLETRVLLEELIDRFPTLALAEGYRWVPTPELVMRRPARLDLVVNDGHQALSPSRS